MARGDSGRMERLSSIMRRRGIVAPAFETYGGVAGLVDYGPLGASIRRRVIDTWIEYWSSSGDILEIESPTITPEEVLVASGHVGEFNDLMTTCKSCEAIFRADHLLEGFVEDIDGLSPDKISSTLAKGGIVCPGCGKSDWSECVPMNLMFKTSVGAMNRGRIAYLRPETAQGMFMQYPMLYRHFRQKLPFGGIQTGKGYRNEISPRQGMIRLREFTMAELEYFFDPEEPPVGKEGDWSTAVQMIPSSTGQMTTMSVSEALDRGLILHPTVAWFIARTLELVVSLGVDSSRLRFRQHGQDEMAHYASDCWDCELHGEHGWIECVGIANRTCHDLEQHAMHTGKSDFRAWRSFKESKTVKIDKWFPVQSSIGPSFKGLASAVSKAIGDLDEIPESLPFTITLDDGTEISIDEGMAERRTEDRIVTGEWFTPHVVEPAFGIDRIIWHILDHAYEENVKEGEHYAVLRLPQKTAPFDAVVLPLFDKDGMDDMAETIAATLSKVPGLKLQYDNSKSIGRRYARADEAGIPWAITVDHQSLEDSSVTLRRRDDGKQVRCSVADLQSILSSHGLDMLF